MTCFPSCLRCHRARSISSLLAKSVMFKYSLGCGKAKAGYDAINHSNRGAEDKDPLRAAVRSPSRTPEHGRVLRRWPPYSGGLVSSSLRTPRQYA